MPSCLVNQCVSKTGKKGQSEKIILHRFPKDFSRIKLWLQQTGEIFKDLNAMALRIFEGKKCHLCSCHFTQDSYIINVHGRTLRVDAIPSIFPIVSEGERIIEENLRKNRKRKRKLPAFSANRFQQPLIPPPSIITNERISVEPEMFQDAAINSFQEFLLQPPTISRNERIKDEEERLHDTVTNSLQELLLQPPTIFTNDRIKVEEQGFFDDVELTKIGYCSIGTQTDYTLSNSILVFKGNQAIGADGRYIGADAIPPVFLIANEAGQFIEESARKRKMPFYTAADSLQEPLIQPPTSLTIERIKVEEEMLQDTATSSLQEPLIQPPTTSTNESIKVKDEKIQDTTTNCLQKPLKQPSTILRNEKTKVDQRLQDTATNSLQKPLILPPTILKNGRIKVEEEMLQDTATNSLQKPLIQPPTILKNGRIKVEEEMLQDTATNSLQEPLIQPPTTLTNERIKVAEEMLRDTATDSLQNPLIQPPTTSTNERIKVAEEVLWHPATNSLQRPLIRPPTTSTNERIQVAEETLRYTATNSLQKPVKQPPTILKNEIIKVKEDILRDVELAKRMFRSVGTQTYHTLSNSIVLFRENQGKGSDVLDGPPPSGVVYEKPEIISRILNDHCHTADVQTITVKEEPEDFSEIDMSTRYWRVENSASSDQQELLSQVQTCNGVEQPVYRSEDCT